MQLRPGAPEVNHAREPTTRGQRRYSDALGHHRAGDLDGAERAYLDVLGLDPDHAGALHHLGLVARARGHLDKAVALLARAAKHTPDDPALRTNLGNLLGEADRWGDAAGHYRAALRCQPDYANARYGLGTALRNLGDADGAEPCFRILVNRFPHDAANWLGWSAALLDAGRAEEAVRAGRRAVDLAPDLAEAHNNLGLAYVDEGQFESGVQCFRRALEVDPHFAKPCFNLSKIRRFDDPRDPDIERMASLLESSRQLRETMRMELHFALGKAFDDCGAYDVAFPHFRQANELKRRRVAFDPERPAARARTQIATFDWAFFERRPEWGSDSEQPVFVVGMPRSGTSLVEQILASHPRVVGAGELPHIERAAAGLSRRLGCSAPYPQSTLALEPAVALELANEYLRSLASRVDAASAERIVDKTPGNFLDLGLIALLFPRARIIHCRRNPLDVCLSLYFHHFTRGHAYAYCLQDIAAEYRAYHRLMAHWREVLPLAMHDVDYEALVHDQESASRQLVDFCGLGWDEACLAFHTTRRPVHTASAWQVRQPVYTRAVGRWRHYERHLGSLKAALLDFI